MKLIKSEPLILHPSKYEERAGLSLSDMHSIHYCLMRVDIGTECTGNFGSPAWTGYLEGFINLNTRS